MNKLISTFCLALALTGVSAQTSVDDVLSSIAKSNKSILANKQYWEARKLGYKTGLTPDNPSAEVDYLVGNPATAGNQTELLVTQSFDFPTAYGKKKQVSNRQIDRIDSEIAKHRQEVLLKAKQLCLELISLNKKRAVLEKRKQNAETMFNAFKEKLDKEDASALDVNKAKLQFINTKNELRLVESAYQQTTEKLTELNGGTAIALSDTEYPLTPAIPDFATLHSDIVASDLTLKSMEQQRAITEKQVGLSRAMSLPKLEAGYHYEGGLGQTFSGAHLGITIPLWENRNTVKMRKAEMLFSDYRIEQHKIERQYEIKQLYEKYVILKEALGEYGDVFGTLNSEELLKKSLTLGQISFIEYALEIEYYYNSKNKYLELEKEYHQTIAALYKYTL